MQSLSSHFFKQDLSTVFQNIFLHFLPIPFLTVHFFFPRFLSKIDLINSGAKGFKQWLGIILIHYNEANFVVY